MPHRHRIEPADHCVLVVEDDPASALFISSYVRHLGYRVPEVAATRADALALAERHRPDLALMDVNLGGDDGIQLAEELRTGYDIPSIFLTAYDLAELPELAEADMASGYAYIQKPINHTELRTNIKIVILNHRLARALAESERRYRDLFENAVVGVFRTSASGRPLAANETTARMLGYDTVEELLTTVRDVSVQLYADPEKRAELMERLGAEGEVRQFSSEVYGRDGDVLWVNLHCRLLDDPEFGRCIEGFMMDITHRVRAEQQAEVSTAMLEQTLACIPHALAILDEEQFVVLTNPAFTTCCGEQATEGRFVDLLESGDREAWQSAFSAFWRAPQQGAHVQARLGDHGSCRISLAPYRDKSGEIMGCIVLFDPAEAGRAGAGA